MRIPQSIDGISAIKFYKGDYYSLVIKVNPELMEIIDYLTISCKSLGICGAVFEKEEENNLFYYEFLAEDTKNFPIIKTTCDVSVVFIGDKPISQCGIWLEVKDRKNDCEIEG